MLRAYPIMISPLSLVLIVVLVFSLFHILVIFAEPSMITEAPSRESALESVGKRAWGSLTLLGVILAAISISVVQEHGSPLSNASLGLAAGFSFISFLLKDIGKVRKIFYRLQGEAIKYAAFLFFLSLYFIAEKQQISMMVQVLAGVILLSIAYMFIMMTVYLFIKYRRWNRTSGQSRRDFFKNL